MAKSEEHYHEGERAVQRAAGEEDAARQNSAIIADRLMAGAIQFLSAQHMLVVASRDAEARPWVSLIFGEAGFLSSDGDGEVVRIDRTKMAGGDADILWSNLKAAAPLGFLAIDLSSRRRVRINGRVERLTKDEVALHVDQAYPNCPKYIQRRRLRTAATPGTEKLPAREGRIPHEAILQAVSQADTIFIASGHPSRGLDASHRGGVSGFVQVLSPSVFRIPDYVGNGMFNTLGNLFIDPRCGLTLIDFQSGRLYQTTGIAKLHLDAASERDDSAATGRFWDFSVQNWRSTDLPIRGEWEFVDYSPYNPP